LVYNSNAPADLYDRFIGVEGTAYLVGGVGVNFQKKDNIILAPIRTGPGARLGANVGYLKYSGRATWNPF
ncbi:MAG TPA: EipA family protein, partial [Aestuariivirga sp.]|nr:EipA family protein [Aestuariivirga sp.]